LAKKGILEGEADYKIDNTNKNLPPSSARPSRLVKAVCPNSRTFGSLWVKIFSNRHYQTVDLLRNYYLRGRSALSEEKEISF
jgi:hypothetical protein